MLSPVSQQLMATWDMSALELKVLTGDLVRLMDMILDGLARPRSFSIPLAPALLGLLWLAMETIPYLAFLKDLVPMLVKKMKKQLALVEVV